MQRLEFALELRKNPGNSQSWKPQSDSSSFCGCVSLVTGTLDWPVDFQSLSGKASGDYGRSSVGVSTFRVSSPPCSCSEVVGDAWDLQILATLLVSKVIKVRENQPS